MIDRHIGIHFDKIALEKERERDMSPYYVYNYYDRFPLWTFTILCCACVL